MGAIVIRDARPGDGERVAAQHLESARYYCEIAPDFFRVPDDEGLAEWLDSWLPANGKSEIALAAEIDGEVVGYLEARLEPPMDGARFQSNPSLSETRLFINAVATDRTHWRRGVATRLVEAAEDWGRSRGATVAVCDTFIGSPVSIPFWERRMGYRRRAVIFDKRLA